MITSSYSSQSAYTRSVEKIITSGSYPGVTRITKSGSVTLPEARDLMNPSNSSESLKAFGWEYSSEQIDLTRPNHHEWHGWAEDGISGEPDFGGSVRSVLLSGSHGEFKAVDVDSNINTETLETSWSASFGQNVYIKQNAGIGGGLYIGLNAGTGSTYIPVGSTEEGDYGIGNSTKRYRLYVDGLGWIDSLESYRIDTKFLTSSDARIERLNVTTSSKLSGSTQVTGSFSVTGSSSFTGPVSLLGTQSTLLVSGASTFTTTSTFEKDVYVEGDLYVQGSASYMNVEQLYVEDKSITIASGSTTPEQADGAGFDIDGAGVTFHYNSTDDQMHLNKGLDVDGNAGIHGDASIDGNLTISEDLAVNDISASGNISAVRGNFTEITASYVTSSRVTATDVTSSNLKVTDTASVGYIEGDGSGLTNVTMSVSNSPKCKHVINLTAGQTFSCTHPFQTQNVLVQVYKWEDSTYKPLDDEDESLNWDENAIQVTDAIVKVYLNTDPSCPDKYKVDVTYPSELYGYVVIADAGIYLPTELNSGSIVMPSGSVGFVDIVEATREVKWFGEDGGLGIVPISASVTGIIEKGESYKFSHNLGTKNIIVQVYKYYPRVDSNTQEIVGWKPVQIYPEYVAINDINQIEVKFSTDPEQGEDPELPQYFGYIVLGKAGCILKNNIIDLTNTASLDEAGVHYGTSGSYSFDTIYASDVVTENSLTVRTASISDCLTVGSNGNTSSYIDTPRIGNLNTGEQYYYDYYGTSSWGSYMEFTDHGIASYVRTSGDDDGIAGPDPIPTASFLDSNGDLYLRGVLHTNQTFATSDIREKQNVQTLENALENVQKLRGVSFEWKKDGQKSIGTIAQEIQSIYPELTKVYKNLEGNERVAVNYEGLVGVLIEAVKALTLRVEQLEKNENR